MSWKQAASGAASDGTIGMLRDPGTAAVLSLFPGLGQLYNGESRKGVLFIDVWLVNLTLLLVAAFAVPLSSTIQQVGLSHNFKANAALIHSLSQMGAGSAPFLVLFVLSALFMLYAARDAHDTAMLKRKKAIYHDSVVDLSEATSGSYLIHGASMVALFVLALFFLVPQDPPRQITEIEFLTTPPEKVETPVKPTNVRAVANSRSGGTAKDMAPRLPSKPATAVSQPRSANADSHASAQPARPVTAQPAHMEARQPAAAQVPQPPAPQPRFAPQPVKIAALLQPQLPAPMPAAQKSVQPTLRTMPPQTASSANHVPAPLPEVRLANATNSAAPQPVSVKTASAQGVQSQPAPAVIKRSESTGVVGAPEPAVAASNHSGSSGSPVPVLPGSPSSGIRSASDRGSSMQPRRSSNSGSMPGMLGDVKPAVAAALGGKSADATRPPGVDAVHKAADFAGYMRDLERSIRRCWMPRKTGDTRSTVVFFTISRSGALSGLRVERSSGDAGADQVALAAVSNAAPFPHLPPNADESVDIQFTFDYKVFGGGHF